MTNPAVCEMDAKVTCLNSLSIHDLFLPITLVASSATYIMVLSRDPPLEAVRHCRAALTGVVLQYSSLTILGLLIVLV